MRQESESRAYVSYILISPLNSFMFKGLDVFTVMFLKYEDQKAPLAYLGPTCLLIMNHNYIIVVVKLLLRSIKVSLNYLCKIYA